MKKHTCPNELLTKYESIIETDHKFFQTLLISPDWNYLKTKNDVKLFNKSFEGSKFKIFKTEFFIPNVTAKVYYEYYYEPVNSENWDVIKKRTPLSEFYKIIDKFNEEFYLVHTGVDTGKLVSDREFLYFQHTKWFNDPDLLSVVFCPIKENDDKFVPIKESHIRGVLRLAHIFSNETVDGKKGVKVSKMVFTDVKGWIPGFLYNRLAVESTLDIACQPKGIFEKKG